MQWKEECLEVVEGSITNDLCEKMKERLKETENRLLCDAGDIGCTLGIVNSMENAIEIVNQVAEEYGKDINVRSNEFCEWIRDNDEFDVYDTKCRNRHVFFEGSPEDNEYVYCPYCGKEIKVVE